MAKRIAVVVSQGQSQNPAKRQLEEDIVAGLMMEPGIDVTVIPNLYDLSADSTGMLALQGIRGNLVVMSWLYSRAAHWVLDRNEIHGHVGHTMLVSDDDDDDDEDEAEDQLEAEAEKKPRVVDEREIPNRKIYCIEMRVANQAQQFIDEVKRIAQETSTQVVDLGGWIGGTASPSQMQRFHQPTNDTAVGNTAPAAGGNGSHQAQAEQSEDPATRLQRIDEEPQRRWYPVIDYSRCTNCMECIDFCLFGVYGVDGVETILVEQPDNCRKGCPACSRVCPENAIIFPQHKTPAIAGAPGVGASLKIDLSQLFGGGEGGDALEIAARERDEQLMMAGRDAVGMSVGMPKRQTGKPKAPKDDLDGLVDELDELEL